MKSALENFFCLSSYSEWAEVKDRERLALIPKLMAPFLKSVSPTSSNAFFYLTTCHRIEVYGFGVDPALVRSSWCEATDANPTSLKIWREVAALEHFIRVCSGLESKIVGEHQIIGQVRNAMKECQEMGILGSPMNHILQRGLKIARTVRTESRIGEGRENLASVAIMSLYDIFESLNDKHFLIVGAGAMAILAIEKLRALKVTNITWMNRSVEKIESHPYARFCKVESFQNINAAVAKSAVTILATSSPHPLLTKETLCDASRKTAKLRVILDLGLPRNASEDVQSIGFILRNVDEFKEVLDDQDALRRDRVEHAERILRRDLKGATTDLELSDLGPLKTKFINMWKAVGEQIVLENSREMVYNRDRFWARLGHVFITKANDLGPLEGGEFLKNLCEGFEALSKGEEGENVDLTEKVLEFFKR